MLNPSIGKLIAKENNRYRLVLRVAHEARRITDKARADGVELTEKPVTLAMDEIAAEECGKDE